MTDRGVIERILEIAVQAPSGDNAQPWEFSISDDGVTIFNVPGKDATLYNFKERGSYVGHGAVIENICIESAAQGLESSVTLFPGEENAIAKIAFSPGAVKDEILAKNISKRSTNRKPYLHKALDPDDREALLKSTEPVTGPKLYFADADKVHELADCVSMNERILFENKELHNFLFSMIRWSRVEEMQNTGLYVKTMEFPLPLQFLLRYVFSDFTTVTALNAIGLSRFIPTQSAAVYRMSSGFFAITIQGTSNAEYVSAGRAMQRLWLTAQQRSLNVQPTAGIPYLADRIKEGEGAVFSAEHQQTILDTASRIYKVFDIHSEHIAMLVRVGYGSDPTARSLKAPPKIR